MEFSSGVIEVEIYDSNFTLLRYTNATGLRNLGHATLALEDVEGIFRKANLEGKIQFLREGKGHRTVKFDVFMTEAMMDSFGFNEVG